jgi:hypothetical protein
MEYQMKTKNRPNLQKGYKLWCMVSILLLTFMSIGCLLDGQGNLEEIPSEELTEQDGIDLPLFYVGAPEVALELQERDLDVIHIDPTAVHSELDLGSTHILIIDGFDPVDTEFLKREILAGNPVITLSNTNLLQALVEEEVESGLAMSPSLSSKSESETDANDFLGSQYNTEVEFSEPDYEPIHSVEWINDQNNEDVLTMEAGAFGVLASNGISMTYYSSETDLMQSAYAAYRWAHSSVEEVSKNQEMSPRTSANVGTWRLRNQRSWFSKDAYKDKGKINVTTTFYQLENDGSSKFDYWLIEFKLESVPGTIAYGSKWGTRAMYITLDADNGYSDYFLSEKSPSTTATGGSGDVGVSLSLSGPEVSKSWSYGGDGVSIYEKGDKGEGTAKWTHDMDWQGPKGQNTYEVKPGAIVRVPNGTQSPWSKWFEYYSVTWMKKRGLTRLAGTELHYETLKWWPSIYYGKKVLRVKSSNKCVDVSGASNNRGANVYQYTCSGGKNQKWEFVPQFDGYYRIVAEHSNKCLDVNDNSTSNGANVHQWDCHGKDNQKWKIINRGGGYYAIQSKRSGKCLNIEGGGQNNTANLTQRDCTYANNQLFKRE